jgi:hypothetical protein
MRKPNAIDFWRGYALISIFVNHIPGNFFERFQYRNLTLSDSAELFVFLAGWAMRLSIENPKRPMTNAAVVYKLWGRAFTIYVAQTFLTEAAIFILAAASVVLDAPFLLDWHNVGAVFHQPVEAHIGLVALTYQLGYFNILPLYIVLMIAAPAVALLYRSVPALLLPLSVAIYVLTLQFGWNIPSWPIEGTWFFSPSAWQLIYVLGFLIAGRTTDLGAFARRHLRWFQIIAVPIVVGGMVIASTRYYPNWITLPKLNLFFVVYDKTFLSPDRLFSVLAIIALGHGLFNVIDRWAPALTRFFSRLGRNGLQVFCAGSLLSLCGQIVRYIYGGTILIDIMLFTTGVAVMAFIAWVLEWRTRISTESSRVETPRVEAAPAGAQAGAPSSPASAS